MITRVSFFTSVFASVCLSSHALAESALRVVCEKEDVGASIYVNGVIRGNCPSDIFVKAGDIHLRVVSAVDDEYERVFEDSFSIFDNSAKKVRVTLSNPQLSEAAIQRRKEAKEKEEKEYASGVLIKARSGDVSAMREMSELYVSGVGVEKNRDKSSYWLDRALEQEKITHAQQTEDKANAGDVDSMLELVRLYRSGIGVEVNERKAQVWQDKAEATKVRNTKILAESGNEPAMYDIAVYYRDGVGVPVDKDKAEYWMKKYEDSYSSRYLQSAESGVISSVRNLSLLYQRTGNEELVEKWSKEYQRLLRIRREEDQAKRKKSYRDSQLSEVDFGKYTQFIIEEFWEELPPLVFTSSIPTLIIVPVMMDLVSAPTNTTEVIKIYLDLAARPAIFNNPESMIAQAYEQKRTGLEL